MQSSAGFIIEVSSIARGYYILDECLKTEKLHIIEASQISPGKFMIFLKGSLDAVGKGYERAVSLSTSVLIDSAMLTHLHEGILKALYGLSKTEVKENGVAIVESTTLSGMLFGLHSVTALVKDISFIEVRSGRDIGGKSAAYFTGSPDALKSSVETFARVSKQRGSFLEGQVINSPHTDFLSYFNISGAN